MPKKEPKIAPSEADRLRAILDEWIRRFEEVGMQATADAMREQLRGVSQVSKRRP